MSHAFLVFLSCVTCASCVLFFFFYLQEMKHILWSSGTKIETARKETKNEMKTIYATLGCARMPRPRNVTRIQVLKQCVKPMNSLKLPIETTKQSTVLSEFPISEQF